METPDPPNDTPGALKQVVLTPHDIPWSLRGVQNHFPFKRHQTNDYSLGPPENGDPFTKVLERSPYPKRLMILFQFLRLKDYSRCIDWSCVIITPYLFAVNM